MSKLKIGLTLLFSALGVFGVNEYYKPRNVRDLLKWQGVQLSSDSKVWESMFFEYETELKGKNINSDTELWKWCEERFNSSNLGDTGIVEEARKYCSDSATSIMGRIIREGEEGKLIKDDMKAFSINYLVASNKDEVLKLIGFQKEGDQEQQQLDKVAEQMKVWCKKEERTNVKSQEDLGKFSEFKKRCYDLGVRNFADLLRKQKRKLMDAADYSRRFKEEMRRAKGLIEKLDEILKKEPKKSQIQWLARRKSLNDFNDSLDSLKKALKNDKDFVEIGALLYKSYCDSKWKQDLISNTQDLGDYAEVSSRCTESEI